MSEELSAVVDGHVGVLQIHRPPHNHFSLDVLTELADTAEELAADGCRALVLCSEGKNFCAGVDFAAGGVGESPVHTLSAIYGQGLRLYSLPVPVIAAVQGAAVGGGLGLACSADFRVASPSTRFHANFGRLGLHQGFGLSVSLPRIVGAQKAADLFYTARRVPGQEAHALGLADLLVEDGAVREAALEHAHRIADSAPLAVRSMKATLRADLLAALPAALEREIVEQTRLLSTKDNAAGVTASLDRTTPTFTGA
ncbi:enoyl-CoA hydratase/isomerase family protein [Nocardiopsis sp. MG754419]|uniref:enoyl-CoA hydratase/isomerase family protein n=1 Tax=Nocardiopsis sp. MG754419 TaxID=2259865 RepID=UPI001BA67D82|nr:enoyl-CoA hydratase/isomerase family protein [Nocardiopsis sp. MG754419]MBR8744550.1 enoyl-CoA hydratase/isomerase family protein [Nocardiopsis sp. MG754419]